MIELLWVDMNVTATQAMMCISDLIAWLVNTINLEKKYHEVTMNGYIVIRDVDDSKKINTLLMCGEGFGEKLLLELLQQPPGEFQGKYIARILSQEPLPVVEVPTSEEK